MHFLNITFLIIWLTKQSFRILLAADLVSATATLPTDAADKQEQAAGKEQTAGQDLVNALLAPTADPSHEDLSGSILAVASLSEPLVTTLESLDNKNDANPTTTTAPPASNLTINPELTESTAASELEDGELESSESDLFANGATNGSDEKKDTATAVIVESAAQSNPPDQAVAAQKQQDGKALEEGQLVPDQDIQMSEKTELIVDPSPSDPATETNQTKDTSATATESAVENGTAGNNKSTSPQTGVPIPHNADDNTSPTAPFKAAPPPALSTQQDPSRPSPTMTRNTLSPVHPDASRSALMDINHTMSKPAQPTSLPPLSSIAGAPSHPASQSARPSRSTMSVSALLLNNDDDSEQEQDRGRRTAGSMFDPFGNPPSRNRSLSPPPPVAPPQHAALPGQHNQPGPGASQHSSAPPPGPPSIPPPRSLSSVHREPPMPGHSDHSGYGRGMPDLSQSSRRSQDFTSAPGGGIRGSSKDYPADEVMESGGVIGYGSQRNRLPSPVGARPHQEPLPVPGVPGGPTPPGSSKLPGLGSVTGGAPPPPHSHDHHNRHRPMYRPEGNHPPMNSGRPNSYSPNQHPNMTHSPPVNGLPHPHYQPNGPSHHHHPSGMVSNAPLPPMSNMVPVVERHVPRLIVKNDPNLKMNSRPELFLGM